MSSDEPTFELDGATLVDGRSSLGLSFSDEITLMDDLPVPSPEAKVVVLQADEEPAFLTAGLVDDGLTTVDEDPPDSAETEFFVRGDLPAFEAADQEDDGDGDAAETLFMSRKKRPSLVPVAEAPPALPLPLSRKVDNASWLERLPAETRHVLESAQRPMPAWPRANRVDGAVVTPVKRIPSLRA